MIINEFNLDDCFGFADCVAPAFRSKISINTPLSEDWYLSSKMGKYIAVDIILHAHGAEVIMSGKGVSYSMQTKETEKVDYVLLDKLCNLDPAVMTVQTLINLGFSAPEAM